ncbi:MAG TPA: hypothetical protein VFC26_10015 [Verrucomicrobiae bacterium]|nr:hypothetical protein [Verrucomicrobiae bacterium]
MGILLVFSSSVLTARRHGLDLDCGDFVRAGCNWYHFTFRRQMAALPPAPIFYLWHPSTATVVPPLLSLGMQFEHCGLRTDVLVVVRLADVQSLTHFLSPAFCNQKRLDK